MLSTVSQDADAILSGIREVVAPVAAAVDIDDTDLAILEALVADGRISQRQLAAQLGLTAPTISERMARLERAGVIQGYAAQVDWSVLGHGQVVYLSIKAAAGRSVSDIMRSLWEIPEVEEMTVVTGDLDLLAKLRVRDYAHLREILLNSIWQIGGIQNTSTMLAIAEMPSKSFAAGILAGHRH
jgi:Lrp/AsnC family leucine-responsive transcriptional regulator